MPRRLLPVPHIIDEGELALAWLVFDTVYTLVRAVR